MGYVVTEYNQPRLIGVGVLTLSLGSLTMALPHFLTNEYKPRDLPPPVCHIDTGMIFNLTSLIALFQ